MVKFKKGALSWRDVFGTKFLVVEWVREWWKEWERERWSERGVGNRTARRRNVVNEIKRGEGKCEEQLLLVLCLCVCARARELNKCHLLSEVIIWITKWNRARKIFARAEMTSWKQRFLCRWLVKKRLPLFSAARWPSIRWIPQQLRSSNIMIIAARFSGILTVKHHFCLFTLLVTCSCWLSSWCCMTRPPPPLAPPRQVPLSSGPLKAGEQTEPCWGPGASRAAGQWGGSKEGTKAPNRQPLIL